MPLFLSYLARSRFFLLRALIVVQMITTTKKVFAASPERLTTAAGTSMSAISGVPLAASHEDTNNAAIALTKLETHAAPTQKKVLVEPKNQEQVVTMSYNLQFMPDFMVPNNP
ncbi:unnamed protein product, partial [Amoebophrya sp. A120]|eukprot:GSA120T00005533001.1